MSEVEDTGFDGLFRVAATPAYHDLIRSVEPGFPDWLVPSSALDLPLLTRMLRTLNVGPESVLLDLACGGGGPALWVAQQAGCSVIGVDGSTVAVETARALAAQLGLSQRSDFAVADATATGLADASVDAVMSIYALMFIDPESVAREIARVLRPGGIAAILTAEAIVEPPPRPTMVADYTPSFESAGLQMLEREPIGEALWVAFFEAALERTDAFRREAAQPGEELIEEATTWLARAKESRSRSVLLAAKRA